MSEFEGTAGSSPAAVAGRGWRLDPRVTAELAAAQAHLRAALVAAGLTVHQLDLAALSDPMGLLGVMMHFRVNDGPEMHQLLDFYGATLKPADRAEWLQRQGLA